MFNYIPVVYIPSCQMELHLDLSRIVAMVLWEVRPLYTPLKSLENLWVVCLRKRLGLSPYSGHLLVRNGTLTLIVFSTLLVGRVQWRAQLSSSSTFPSQWLCSKSRWRNRKESDYLIRNSNLADHREKVLDYAKLLATYDEQKPSVTFTVWVLLQVLYKHYHELFENVLGSPKGTNTGNTFGTDNQCAKTVKRPLNIFGKGWTVFLKK